MAFKKLTNDLAQIWDKENVKTVSGVIVDIKEHIGQYDSKVYTLEQKGGETVAVFAKGALEGLLHECKVGGILNVTYKGKVKTKNGRMANAFEAEYDGDTEAAHANEIFGK